MIRWFIRYVRGYVTIKIVKGYPERFINLCSSHDIYIWKLMSDNNCHEMNILLKDFKKLKPICKKTGTKLIIKSRQGLPFFLYKNRKRKQFLGGVIICIAMIYIMSLFVWDIEISGNIYNTDDVLMKFLNENNIHTGIYKKDIVCADIEKILRIKYPDIIWASVELKGTRILIKIKEGLNTVEIKEKNIPSDLVAMHDCTIESIITRNGTAMVKRGDEIKKGDVLVTGAVAIYDDNGEIAGYDYYEADADIYGKYNIEYRDEFPLKYYQKKYTGKTKLRYYVKILNKKVNIFNGKIVYNKYDVLTNERQLKIGRNFYLPIVLGDINIREYVMEEKLYTKEEAAGLSRKHLDYFLSKIMQKGVQIAKNNVKIHIGKNSCIAKGSITVMGEVSRQKAAKMYDTPTERTNNTDELN